VLRNGESKGSVVMKGPGFYGVPPARPPAIPAGSILRSQVRGSRLGQDPLSWWGRTGRVSLS
jgi:hypothetical protein